ncbi:MULTISPECIES: hypothetical protein [unclassified Janthinobacterium]|uniref:hypothetical protein n=1 Tax=unclassified Janthinobacterium TaxID=2610881 RepID=UPI0016171569|nr:MULTISPECIES: hypothetical protein [unclassified Janthinobacterium]MBB5608659.1 hypothetical protein [Janthinobacterium sp. S3T4]MBB5613938.1 hypothetical protein [Janthinobacterium sp. S3M3]
MSTPNFSLRFSPGILLLACALSACGGGSSSSDTPAVVNPPPPVTPPASGDTGSVSAAYVQGASPRYMLLNVARQSSGILTRVTQGSNGALSVIADNTFSGTPAVTREISGDASFAQGRWFSGTMTDASGTTILSGNNASAHYSVYNAVASLPTSGSLQCDAGTYTAPSYTGGANVQPAAYFGTASGSASVVFGPSGAVLTMTVDATAGGSTGQISGTGTMSRPDMSLIGGGFLGGDSGTLLALGDAGAGRYLVIGGYKVLLANGANYQGIATFHCS